MVKSINQDDAASEYQTGEILLNDRQNDKAHQSFLHALGCFTGNHVQTDVVRSGGSHLSQNDLRIHLGLGQAEKVDRLEVHWPSGQLDVLSNVNVDQSISIWEGGKYAAVK